MNNLKTMSTDASVFEIRPCSVVTPANQEQLLRMVQKFINESIPITMRAAGTSLGGQAIGSGALIDISKHLTSILEYHPSKREIVVEPGVIQDDLNDYIRKDDLRFAPDTSTSNRAMIGGMIGNNSCGSYSVYYGSTREHVKSVDVILADGSEITCGSLSGEQLNHKLRLNNLEGGIYRTVIDVLERHGSEILESYPHHTILRRNTGYALDVLFKNYQPFNKKGSLFSLVPLICGSEGTLAVIKKATLSLVDLPKQTGLICAQFHSISTALELVTELLKFAPAAIELIDKATLDATLNNIQQKQNRFWIEGDPHAVLIIEIFDDDLVNIENRLKTLSSWLLENSAYAAPIVRQVDAARVWDVRKSGLGLLMGGVTRQKAVAVIEDAAVPTNKLSAYFREVKELMAELNVTSVYYGHVSVGLIHIRPELDLATSKGRRLFALIAQRHAALVKKYQGALSGEHGDGRIRAPFLKEYFGEKTYECLVEIKRAFDSNNILNPGVIIGDMPITKSLRAFRKPWQSLSTGFNWESELSILDAVEKCNGAGACRKSAGKGVMCPSYQISREEKFSTRGRSNLLRFALTEPKVLEALSDIELRKAMDLCLACKACKAECPASVDMARLKSELLYVTRKSLRCSFDLSRLIIKHYSLVLKLGQKIPSLFNWVQSLNVLKALLGVDVSRRLPELHSFNVENWWCSQVIVPKVKAKTIWVMCDLYGQYYEPNVSKAVLSFALKTGFNVRPVFMRSSPRALISKGLLDEAKSSLYLSIEQVSSMSDDDLWVGVEPSEVLVWRDEASALLSKDGNMWLQNKKLLLFEELILLLANKDELPKVRALNKKLFLHVHCHQKALAKPVDSLKALQMIPGLDVEVIQSGCCGMSGDFGYKHFNASREIAEQAIIPEINKLDKSDLIVATGTSCRYQIKDFTGRESMHCAEVFDLAVA